MNKMSDRAKEIFMSVYNKKNMHWYYTFESGLKHVAIQLDNIQLQLTSHADDDSSDTCDQMYLYRDTVMTKLNDELSMTSIHPGKVLYYTAILKYLREYHAVIGRNEL